jgi:hypothetical protein
MAGMVRWGWLGQGSDTSGPSPFGDAVVIVVRARAPDRQRSGVLDSQKADARGGTPAQGLAAAYCYFVNMNDEVWFPSVSVRSTHFPA